MTSPAVLGPVVVDLQGTTLKVEEKELLAHPLTGGVIFFSRNFESPIQLSNLIASIHAVRPNLLLMVDQEGGRVQRFKAGFTRLPALQTLGKLYLSQPAKALELAHQHAWLMAAELVSVGVDLSLAPVLDIDEAFSQVIGDRSFSADQNAVIALSHVYVQGMKAAGMASIAKHFPGHGIVRHDSHLTLPICDEPFDQVERFHMRPFKELSQDFSGVMPAHIVFSKVDKNPVGFSAHWLQNVLRQELGFRGVIFSDDLSMAGAAWAGDYSARAHLALAAGCDALLVCNQPTAAWDVLESLHALGVKANNTLAALKAKRGNASHSLSALQSTSMWQNYARNMNMLEV